MPEVQVHCAHDEIADRSDLKFHPLNPNTHPDDQVKKLAKMIRHHGWRMPVTVSKLSGYVVRGHGRLLAADMAGIGKIPVDYQDYGSEDEELADLVADNKVFEGSELDGDITNEILGILDGEGFDIELAGFDISEFRAGKGEDGPSAGQRSGSSAFVQLPYVFKKLERDRIMKILDAGKTAFDTGEHSEVLLSICSNIAKNLNKEN